MPINRVELLDKKQNLIHVNVAFEGAAEYTFYSSFPTDFSQDSNNFILALKYDTVNNNIILENVSSGAQDLIVQLTARGYYSNPSRFPEQTLRSFNMVSGDSVYLTFGGFADGTLQLTDLADMLEFGLSISKIAGTSLATAALNFSVQRAYAYSFIEGAVIRGSFTPEVF